jgi:8-oxo-dGTP pyrophosphatase MutT (NUDIX family)
MRTSNESCDGKPPKWARALAAVVGHRYSQSDPPPQQTVTLRAAAVLVLLTDGPDGVQVLLTERASGLGNYSGQLSFPGGARDAADADPTGTALREAHEEVGLNLASVHVLGLLPAFVDPKAKFLVTPVLAWSARPDFTGPVSAGEVARVHQAAVHDLSPTNATGPGNKLGKMTSAIIDLVSALLSGQP